MHQRTGGPGTGRRGSAWVPVRATAGIGCSRAEVVVEPDLWGPNRRTGLRDPDYVVRVQTRTSLYLGSVDLGAHYAPEKGAAGRPTGRKYADEQGRTLWDMLESLLGYVDEQ